MAIHNSSHIPGHMKVGPNHKNTQGVSRDAGIAQNMEKTPISLSPPIHDSRFPDSNSSHMDEKKKKSTPIGAPGNI